MPPKFNPQKFVEAIATLVVALAVSGFVVLAVVYLGALVPPHDHHGDEHVIEEALKGFYEKNKK